MRRLVFVWIGITLSLSLTLSQPKSAWACSCVMPPTPVDAFSQWAAVFQGTVTTLTDSRPLPFIAQIREWFGLPDVYDYGSRKFSLEVTRSWKGVTTTRSDVRTGYGSADCGYEFVIGTSYVVYANRTTEGDWGTNICTRTNLTTSAIDDLAYLGLLPTLPLTPVAAPFNWLWVCVGVLVVVTTLSLVTLWIVYRKRTHRLQPPTREADF